MIKKLLVASAILAASVTTVYANGAPYVGASVGVNASQFQWKDNATYKNNLGNQNLAGKIFGGYGGNINPNFYLAGELFGDFTSTAAKAKTTDNIATNVQLTQKYGYGVSVIPGVMLNNATMAFARVGIVRTRFDAQQSSVVAANSQNHMMTGGQMGVGLQTCVAPNLHVRGEYDYTQYGSATFAGNKMSPRNGQANVGLVYTFN